MYNINMMGSIQHRGKSYLLIKSRYISLPSSLPSDVLHASPDWHHVDDFISDFLLPITKDVIDIVWLSRAISSLQYGSRTSPQIPRMDNCNKYLFKVKIFYPFRHILPEEENIIQSGGFMNSQ